MKEKEPHTRPVWLLLLTLGLLCLDVRTAFAQIVENLLLHARTATTSSTIREPAHVMSWSLGHTDRTVQKPQSDSAYWIELNRSFLPDSGFLIIPGQSAISVWAGSSSGKADFQLGLSRPMHQLPVRGNPNVLPLDFVNNAEKIVLRIIPFSQQPYPIEVGYQTPSEYRDALQERLSRRTGYYLFLGAGVLTLLFLCAFALFQYATNRKEAYLFYGLYMLCMAFYFGKLPEYYYGVPVFWGYFFNGYGLAEVVALMVSYVMYVLFTKHFLSLGQPGKSLAIFIRIWIALCLSLALTAIVLAIFRVNSSLFLEVYTIARFLMPLLVLYFIWRIYNARLPYARYVLYGTAFLLLGGLLALLVTFVVRSEGGILLREPFFFMLSGVLLESFAFAVGLGKQARQTELDKVAAQEQLINQLQREAQLERDIRESQVQALRAQMNPHFIFNALNSIQHFIISNQTEMSVRYLSKVSQLIRRILQNSTSPNITLDEELQTLNSYIEIEQLRFHPAFTYELEVDEHLDTEWVRIPHMVLQPFIENAILHGLVHKKEPGVLSLKIVPYSEEAIKVTITDNGIGREEAALMAQRNPRKHKSISSDSIRERLRLLMPGEAEPLVIEDLKDEEGRAVGTKVRLIIPII